MLEVAQKALDEGRALLSEALDRLTDEAVEGLYAGDEDAKRTAYEAFAMIDMASDRINWLLQGAEIALAEHEPGFKVWRSGINLAVARSKEEATRLLETSSIYTASEAHKWLQDHAWEALPDDEIVEVDGHKVSVARVRRMATVPILLGAQ